MTTHLLALALVSGLTTAEPASEPGPGTPAPAVEPASSAPPGRDATAQTPTPEPGPGAPAPAVKPAATPPGKSTADAADSPHPLQVIAGLAVAEGMFALVSSGAANDPQGTGWKLVGVSPVFGFLVFAMADSQGDANSVASGVAVGLLMAGVGAYNVFELSTDRYSHSDRFWLNMAAWHVGLLGAGAVVALADLAGGPRKKEASTTPQVSLGLTPGGGALLVAGRF